jgi:AcrR family transcriptional regulator
VLDGARRAFASYGYEGATVRRLEEETGLSRGAIFHHFADKDALFLALAQEDAEEVATLVDDFGLVGAMQKLRDKDAGWLGVQLEVSRRVRTDPAFAAQWEHHLRAITRATQARLARQRDAGVVRVDVPIETLAAFLLLVYDGLVAQLATGMPVQHLAACRRSPTQLRPHNHGETTSEQRQLRRADHDLGRRARRHDLLPRSRGGQ